MPTQWEVRRSWHRGWMLLCAAVVSCGKPPRRHRHRHDTGTTKTRRANVRPPKCPEKSRVVSAKATTLQFHAGIRLCHTHTPVSTKIVFGQSPAACSSRVTFDTTYSTPECMPLYTRRA